jgi:hypothetical protein
MFAWVGSRLQGSGCLRTASFSRWRGRSTTGNGHCSWIKVTASQAVGRNGYSSDTRPSSTAALIKAWGSVTPSEAIATIRWAILAFIAGVGREWSIRLTATSSADLIVVSNSGLKLAGVTIGIYSLPREKRRLAVDREAQVSITLALRNGGLCLRLALHVRHRKFWTGVR